MSIEKIYLMISETLPEDNEIHQQLLKLKYIKTH